MSTKIYSANIIIGTDSEQFIIENVAVKKLPSHVLMSDSSFVYRLKSKTTDKVWNKLPKPKGSIFPRVKVVFLKYIGDVGQEPQLTL